MNETKNDANPLGPKASSQQDTNVDQNTAIAESSTEPSAITSNNHDALNGDQPGPGTPDSHRQKTKPGPPSPFDPYWDTEIVPLLEQDVASQMTPAGILDHLEIEHPKAFEGRERKNLLRTLGRSMKKWREEHCRKLPKRWNPCRRARRPRDRRPRQVFLQDHPPGREVQVDFTDCKELAVTIQNKPYPHELFDFRLSYSGWVYVEIFLGETVSALMQGLQNAMKMLEGVPQVVRSDNRRNAIRDKKPIEPYGAFLKHYDLELSLINYGRPRENGGVEGENGRVKERIRQALLIRGSRDFESEEDYAAFVRRVVDGSNGRQKVQHKLKEESAKLRALPQTQAPEYIVVKCRVNEHSLINLYSCRYSVPCQAIGKEVTVRIYAEHLEVYGESGKRLTTWDRVHGNDLYIVNYRHCFPDLEINWGSFGRLSSAHKEQMFPRPSFWKTYEKLLEWGQNGGQADSLNGDYQYVRILHLAAKGKDDQQEEAVDQALQTLLKAGGSFGYEDVERLVKSPPIETKPVATKRYNPPILNEGRPVQRPLF